MTIGMRKTFALILALIPMFALPACSGKTGKTDSGNGIAINGIKTTLAKDNVVSTSISAGMEADHYQRNREHAGCGVKNGVVILRWYSVSKNNHMGGFVTWNKT